MGAPPLLPGVIATPARSPSVAAPRRHLRLALKTEQILVAKNARLRMNYAAMTAALCADLGFSVAEFHLFRVPLFLAGMPPGYIEARDRPEGSLFPVPCHDIAYQGAAPREWTARCGADV